MGEVSKSNFVCISYSSVEFLIPKKDVIAATFCDKSNFIVFEDGTKKINIDSKIIPYIDVDFATKRINQEVLEKEIKTCIVLKNNGYFEDSDFLGIITSSDCKVIEIDLKDFSLFSDFYVEKMRNKGIVACYFREKLGYLVDANNFLKMYQEIML